MVIETPLAAPPAFVRRTGPRARLALYTAEPTLVAAATRRHPERLVRSLEGVHFPAVDASDPYEPAALDA